MYSLDKLREQINSDLGSAPDQINLIDKIQRFDIEKKKDNAGWYVGRDWNYNGKDYASVTYGSWKGTVGPFVWKSWTKQDELEDRSFIKELKRLNELKELELKREAIEAKERILSDFESFKSLKEDNFYLEKKQFSTTKGLLQNEKGNLIVPIYEDIDKNLAGYQKILNQDKYNKQFPSGQQVQGNFFYFGNPKTSDFIYVCEGLATGATIYELTGQCTVVAFQANNLPPVVKKLKHSLAGIKMVIAADNDQAKKNTGFFYAKRAKENSGNVGIIMPKFPKGSKLTDYNDLFVTQGPDTTKEQLYFDVSDFVEVEFLGYDESKFYFYSTRSKDIRSYTTEKIKSGNLIELARESYWAQKYTCIMTKEDEPTDFCNWKLSTEKILEDQQKIGMYSGGKVRGVGSWIDGKNHLINTGERLFLNGSEINYGKNRSLKKFYMPSKEGEVLNLVESKKRYDFAKLKEAFDYVDFLGDRDRIIVLGYLALCQIFTTQRWRSHVWVRADKGTGKSSILEFCAEFLMNSILFQDSTAAGLRQLIGMDSKICLIDEAEGESNKTKQLIELARQSSSGGSTKIARGTTMGQALQYKPEMTFFFASIRAAELTPADKSRILEVSMKKPLKADLDRNYKRESLMHDALDLSQDLFRFMNDNLDEFNTTRLEIKHALNQLGFDNRFADQHSPILAAYNIMLPKEDLEQAIVKVCSPNQESEEKSDQQSFYDDFMGTIIKDGSHERTIFQFIEQCAEDSSMINPLNLILERYGLKYLPNKKTIFVIKNRNLINLVAKSTKFKNYYDQMKNSLNFVYSTQKIKNKPKKGYLIKH